LAGRAADKPVVLLAHQPKAFPEAVAVGVDLQLSGHVHGGQIVPFNWLVHLEQPYLDGLHREKDSWIYVSPGTGYWGPPMRIGTTSEVTRVVLLAG
jgi:predicted MPP superfamily phosphohydrolase